MQGAYNLLQVAEGDEWKIVVQTWYRLYEYLVMPFVLTNVLVDFQHFINDALHLKPEKCHFHKTEVQYLGLIILADGVRMDPQKVIAILE